MSDRTPGSAPVPSDPVDDRDREVAVRVIQQALAREEIEFEELDDRFADVYSANTRAELDAVTSDLPTPPAPVVSATAGHPMASMGLSIFGDLKKSGDLEVGGEVTYGSLFGDVVLDLSSAQLADGSKISVYTLFGDAILILPDGVRVSRSDLTIFGDQKESLSPPLPGSPTVSVNRIGLFGDTKVYSLSRVPKGRIRKLWRGLQAL